MSDKVCIQTEWFIIFIIIIFAIMSWVIYQFLTHNYKQMDNLETFIRKQPNKRTNISHRKPQHHILPPQHHHMKHNMFPPPYIYPILPYDHYMNFQLVGYVYPVNKPNLMFRLMGRQYNSTRYEYYVIHPYNDIQIPIHVKNDWELNTGDFVNIPGFQEQYVVKIYDETIHRNV